MRVYGVENQIPSEAVSGEEIDVNHAIVALDFSCSVPGSLWCRKLSALEISPRGILRLYGMCGFM